MRSTNPEPLTTSQTATREPAAFPPARLSGLLVLLALLAIALTLTVVSVTGGPTASRAEQVHEITSGLRCPVCKDLSAADSPAPLAGQMRAQVAQQLASGRSAEQIRQGFIAAYGESVLMSPPHTGLGQAAYLFPLFLLGGGLVVSVLLLRRWRRLPEPRASGGRSDPLSAPDRHNVEAALMRLREEELR